MVPWPYLDGSCAEEQKLVGSPPLSLGMPCAEGGSVAVQNVWIPSVHGSKHCIVFYQQMRKVLGPEQGRGLQLSEDSIREWGSSIEAVVSDCVESREAREAPVDLFQIAKCIMYSAPLSEPEFPCRGVAAMPKTARSPSEPALWARPSYSGFTARFGTLYQGLVEVRMETDGKSCGVLELCVLVHSPLST